LVDQSGIGGATHNSVQALVRQGIDVTSDPNENYDLLHLHCRSGDTILISWL